MPRCLCGKSFSELFLSRPSYHRSRPTTHRSPPCATFPLGLSDATTTVDTQKAAVLAALAIADELHSGLRERTEQEELLREQAERCLTLVERALKQTA